MRDSYNGGAAALIWSESVPCVLRGFGRGRIVPADLFLSEKSREVTGLKFYEKSAEEIVKEFGADAHAGLTSGEVLGNAVK